MAQKILVIDDDKYFGETVSDALNIAGYITYLAHNGFEGLDSIHEFKPDLVLCDITMPMLNGLSLTEIIRKDNRYDNIPIIFMSALSAPTDVRAGMQIGADDYMTKPFTITELVGAVQARLHRVKKIKLSNSDKLEADSEITKQLDLLTRSEKNIIKHIAAGMTSEQISNILFTSPKTVENHRHNISTKLNLKGKNSLMYYALANKVVITTYLE